MRAAIPATVRMVESCAFAYCDKLTDLAIEGGPSHVAGRAAVFMRNPADSQIGAHNSTDGFRSLEAQSGESVNVLMSKAAVSSFCMDSARFACMTKRAEGLGTVS